MNLAIIQKEEERGRSQGYYHGSWAVALRVRVGTPDSGAGF